MGAGWTVQQVKALPTKSADLSLIDLLTCMKKDVRLGVGTIVNKKATACYERHMIQVAITNDHQ